MNTAGNSDLATSWPANKNLGMIAPVTGTITGLSVAYTTEYYSYECQFALLKGTYTSGTDTTTTLSQIGGSVFGTGESSTSQRYYFLNQTISSSNNISRGDQILIASRGIDVGSSIRYMRAVFTVYFEES